MAKKKGSSAKAASSPSGPMYEYKIPRNMDDGTVMFDGKWDHSKTVNTISWPEFELIITREKKPHLIDDREDVEVRVIEDQ
jgi:hypothetical protein